MVDDTWAAVEQWLEPATEMTKGRLTTEDVRKFCAEGRMMLIVVWQRIEQRVYGAVVVEVVDYPGKRVMEVCLCGGEEIHKWLHLIEGVKEIAKSLGCDQIQLIGRSGWARVLGWPEMARHYVEELS